mmetsp:Transcript_17026/g.57300  ORF Transcript_17026/g.57300 Transcript_17026/m.57300 type:complete len:202 (+) Transcript_17026:163-768(+)
MHGVKHGHALVRVRGGRKRLVWPRLRDACGVGCNRSRADGVQVHVLEARPDVPRHLPEAVLLLHGDGEDKRRHDTLHALRHERALRVVLALHRSIVAHVEVDVVRVLVDGGELGVPRCGKLVEAGDGREVDCCAHLVERPHALPAAALDNLHLKVEEVGGGVAEGLERGWRDLRRVQKLTQRRARRGVGPVAGLGDPLLGI